MHTIKIPLVFHHLELHISILFNHFDYHLVVIVIWKICLCVNCGKAYPQDHFENSHNRLFPKLFNKLCFCMKVHFVSIYFLASVPAHVLRSKTQGTEGGRSSEIDTEDELNAVRQVSNQHLKALSEMHGPKCYQCL